MDLTKEQKQLVLERLDYLTEYDMHVRYDEMLDDVYGMVKVAGYAYATSDLLKNTDPVAYRCGFNESLILAFTIKPIIEIAGEYYDYKTFEEALDEVTNA